MRRCCLWGALALLACALSTTAAGADALDDPLDGGTDGTVRWWVSTQDLKLQLAEQPPLAPAGDSAATADLLRIDPAARQQTMVGLGASLEHTTCFNLAQASAQQRAELLLRLFDRQQGIGMNLMRICIGTSDFTGEDWYSYHDLPSGESDPELSRFSIDRDRAYILPALRAAREANPELLFFASPWSPPGWMKTTGSLVGGSLLAEHHAAYARYFVKFIQAYEAEGIPIHAVTVQNEPGVDRNLDPPAWHYPSCRWKPEAERDFIRDHLGPALETAGLKTQIWCYDHNFNTSKTPDGDDPGTAYPRVILSDRAAARFVSGTAFHGYAGRPTGMLDFSREFPDKPVYFTEGSQFGVAGALRIMAILRGGASSFNAWVTMIDTHDQPNRGPFKNNVTPVMWNPDTKSIEYRFDYFMYGHFMKFIRRGAVRLETPEAQSGRGTVAFENPQGDVAVVAANAGRSAWTLRFELRGQAYTVPVPARAVATIVQPPPAAPSP